MKFYGAVSAGTAAAAARRDRSNFLGKIFDARQLRSDRTTEVANYVRQIDFCLSLSFSLFLLPLFFRVETTRETDSFFSRSADRDTEANVDCATFPELSAASKLRAEKEKLCR